MTARRAALSLPSPLGPLMIEEEDGAIAALRWGACARPAGTALLARARDELAEYFAGARRTFSLPLAPAATAHQRRIRDAMLRIPYGETRSYGALAAAAGSGARAVAGACARNPLPVIVPCHRVVAAGGRIGGYSGGGGIATKRLLLALEARGAGAAG